MSKNILEVKSFIVEKVLEKLSYDEEQIDLQLKTTRQLAIESPGRMQSRYDSSKQELSYLVDSHQERLNQIKKEQVLLKNFKLGLAGDEIKTGDIVKVGSDSNQCFYFILPCGGGKVIETLDFRQVTVITPLSPLGKLLLGKVEGDSLVFSGKDLEVIQIF